MSVVNSYAKALYQATVEKKSGPEVFKRIEDQLDGFIALINGSPDLKVALEAPIITAKDKVHVVHALAKSAGLDGMLTKFLELLASKGRLHLLREVREAFSLVRLQAEGGVSGNLVTADPMSESDIDSLAKAFGQKLGKDVTFQVSTDPSLLAGIKVTVNGVTYDGTLRSQLQRLRDQLVQGTSTAHSVS